MDTDRKKIFRRESGKFADSRFFDRIREKKEVDSSFWFQRFYLWLQVSFGYNNPLNFGCVHSELLFLREVFPQLSAKIECHDLVFLGVGNGDTEMLVIDELLKNESDLRSIVGVDVNSDFLDLFDNSIEMRDLEFPGNKFELHKIVKNFEQLDSGDFIYSNQRSKLVCVLGNTIGNYNNSDDIFSVLERITKTGDQILLSYQLNTHLEKLFDKYRTNRYFLEFITHYLFMQKEDFKYVEWRLNRENNSIEAWLDEIQLFRSRKFPKNEVENLTCQRSFDTIDVWYDDLDNLGVQLCSRR